MNKNAEAVSAHSLQLKTEAPFYQAWIPSAPTVIASLLAVYAVHRLTKYRDREKLLDEFHSKIEKAAEEVSESAFLGWSLAKGPERRKQVAMTKSRLQKLASLINRLELISSRRRFRRTFGWPCIVNVQIKLGSEMISFRQAITADPFEDPNRARSFDHAINCESAKSILLLSLELKYKNWFSPF